MQTCDFIKKEVLAQALACDFIKKEAMAQVFSCEFCEIFKNTFFTEHFRATASDCKWKIEINQGVARQSLLKTLQTNPAIIKKPVNIFARPFN